MLLTTTACLLLTAHYRLLTATILQTISKSVLQLFELQKVFFAVKSIVLKVNIQFISPTFYGLLTPFLVNSLFYTPCYSITSFRLKNLLLIFLLNIEIFIQM